MGKDKVLLIADTFSELEQMESQSPNFSLFPFRHYSILQLCIHGQNIDLIFLSKRSWENSFEVHVSPSKIQGNAVF